MLECPLTICSPLISPLYVRLLQVTRQGVEDEGTKADDESEIIPVGRPLSIFGGCESEGTTFEEAVGRAYLISKTETAFHTAGLPIR